MKKLLLPGILLLILILWQNMNLSHASEIDNTPVLTVADKNLVQADNKFGLKLFREIAAGEGDKNIFISPLSISLALAMTYNGAKDSTFDSLRQTLELHELSLEDINQAAKRLKESRIIGRSVIIP